MSALLPKLLVFIVQPAAQYRHCSAAGFAVRRYLLSDCLLKSVSGRFKWGRWSPKVKYGPLLYRSISAHKKSTVMLLSTRDSWKNRFEKVNTVWSVQVAVRYHCNEIHCTHTYVRTYVRRTYGQFPIYYPPRGLSYLLYCATWYYNSTTPLDLVCWPWQALATS